MIEEFRTIPEYPHYKINRAGDVWSIPRPVTAGSATGTRMTLNKKISQRHVGNRGLRQVSLRRDGRTHVKNIKTLVELAFNDE